MKESDDDLFLTTNQDYGAFYYQENFQACIPDNLKAKNHCRYNRFQDWLLYQTNCQSLSPINDNNNHSIFPLNQTETVRITHRKKNLSKSSYDLNENGLVIELINRFLSLLHII